MLNLSRIIEVKKWKQKHLSLFKMLHMFTHGQLREICKELDCRLGSTKTDAIANIIAVRERISKGSTLHIRLILK